MEELEHLIEYRCGHYVLRQAHENCKDHYLLLFVVDEVENEIVIQKPDGDILSVHTIKSLKYLGEACVALAKAWEGSETQ